MLTVEQALARVLAAARPLPPVEELLQSALGRVLAEPVASDVDSPPHDKSVVDGYAVRAADFAGPAASERWFDVLEEVVAGAVPSREVGAGQATRIMTGAPIPPGADAVVAIEQTRELRDEGTATRVRLETARVALGKNIVRRASSMARGEIVLEPGCTLRPAEIGLLAEVGRTRARVHGVPTVAIGPTGDELVDAPATPGPGQIRNSNGPMLLAAAAQCGATVLNLGIGRDEPAALAASIERGLQADVLVLSGGVSAGVLDLAPKTLAALGVREVFHKVSLKPGKPLWFGVLPAHPIDKLVFGLPGNPVSSLVCFELFVRPALGVLQGKPARGRASSAARLASEFVHRGERPTYRPAWRDAAEGESTVRLLRWQGSGDLRTVAHANCLACFAAGDRHYAAGEAIPVLDLGGAD